MGIKEWFAIDSSDSIEIRLFKKSLIVSIVQFILLMIHELYYDYSRPILGLILCGIIAFCFIFYLSEKKSLIPALMLIYLLFYHFLLTLGWYFNNGFGLGLVLLFMVIMTIGIVISPKEYRILYLSFVAVNLAAILVFETIYTDFYIETISNKLATRQTKAVFVTLSFSLVAYIVNYLKDQYDDAIFKIEVQKSEIQAQNVEIQKYNTDLELLIEQRTAHIEAQKAKLLQYAFFNSHKVRAPLANIKGLVILLKGKDISEKEKNELITLLDKESDRMDDEIKYIQSITKEHS